MADLKQQMNRHLHSAKHWLTRAEDAFDKDSEVRGSLNLFLAQAEIKRLQETKEPHFAAKLFLLRHAAAVLVAVMIVLGGACGYVAFSAQGGTTVTAPQAPMQAANTHDAKALTGGQVASPVPSHESAAVSDTTTARPQAVVPTAKTMAVDSVKQDEHTHEAAVVQRPAVSTDEKQMLIRVAGKSLRGQ